MNWADTPIPHRAEGAPLPWFVGYTKPRQETRATENLRRQGFDCHVPHIRMQKRIGREVRWVHEPMFPRYLFLRPGSGAVPLERVRSTFGMSGLVRFAGLPATMADSLVKKLSEWGDARREELFAQGEAVCFIKGPLVGIEGVFQRADGEDRAIVLLEFLQRAQRVTVSTALLAKAS